MFASGTGWDDPPGSLRLEAGEVHLWRAALEQPAPVLHRLAGSLSEEEQTRCARFRFPHLQTKFQVGRGVLREILSRYLGLAPACLQFTYGEYGKPALHPEQNPGGLQFNLAHSGELALYAVATGKAVGVDLEGVRALDDLDRLAKRNFSPREVREYTGLDLADRQAAFFRCWTRKEAFIKAIGAGLSLPLDQFDVTLLPRQPARLLAIRGEAEAAARWSMVEPEPGAGYAAGLVIEGSITLVRCFHWLPQ